MFRNQYDNDATTWSPQGRLHQVEYACEAVKQGSAVVGLRSSNSVVLAALKRSPHELASYQKKLFRIDDHMAIGIAGLTSDARVLSTYMRTQALKSKTIMKRPLPVQRVVAAMSDRAQMNTQQYGGRPYGVGLLVAGVDETGPHLFEFSPSGNYFDYYAMAIGSRAQSAKTYLEKHFKSFETATDDDLIYHSLRALRDTNQSEKGLSSLNASVVVVSVNAPVRELTAEELTTVLARLEAEAPSHRVTATQDETMADAPAEGTAPMEVE